MAGPLCSGDPSAGAIDLHAHFLTDAYRKACIAAGLTQPDGFPRLPEWDPASALDLMDQVGIQAAVLSVSSPGVYFGDQRQAVQLARVVNDEATAIVTANRTRFGFAASLPLPDVDAAVAEASRALDTLGADAISLHTNYGGLYLGDPVIDPLLARLNASRAIVLLHPTSPACWDATSFGRPRPMVEFLLDTTRTIFNLALRGAFTRFPGVRWVIPHTGGALSVIADRVQLFAQLFAGEDDPPVDVIQQLRGLYYDVAGVPLPRALPALLELVSSDQIVYGSDSPFTPPGLVLQAAEALIADKGPASEWRPTLLRTNAARLFPRFAT
jgi:predicted TIM-barrel fold metal-dependent hydrolase